MVAFWNRFYINREGLDPCVPVHFRGLFPECGEHDIHKVNFGNFVPFVFFLVQIG
jgi:hypothetical protein